MSGSNVFVRLLLGVVVLSALALTGSGLLKIVYFERTPNAISEARSGHLMIAIGCVVLLMCAAVVFVIGPRWAAALIVSPAVACGGLAIFAAGTLLPQLAAVPTYVAAVVGVIGVLTRRGS